jgi:hypothetical protein
VVIAAAPIGRDPAQRLAQRELSKAIYHQQASIPQVVIDAIERFLAWIFGGANQTAPGGWWSLIAVVALLVAVVAVIVARVGPFAGSGRGKGRAVLSADTRPLTARQLRDAAAASAAEGDYSTAILQRLRAIAVSCEERGILVPDTGRTADELAAQAGTRFPGHAAELAEAARVFDRIRYGDGTGTPAGYERLRDLDDALVRSDAKAPGGALAGSAM